jgi:hypothetical protein
LSSEFGVNSLLSFAFEILASYPELPTPNLKLIIPFLFEKGLQQISTFFL